MTSSGALNSAVQLDHLQKESERLTEEKPEEAAVVDEKIVTLTVLWQELKQTVSTLLTLLAIG